MGWQWARPMRRGLLPPLAHHDGGDVFVLEESYTSPPSWRAPSTGPWHLRRRFVLPLALSAVHSYALEMEALSRKTEKEKLLELEQMLADATTLTGERYIGLVCRC